MFSPRSELALLRTLALLALMGALPGCPGDGPVRPHDDSTVRLVDGPGAAQEGMPATGDGPKAAVDGKLLTVDVKPWPKADTKPWPKPDTKPWPKPDTKPAADAWAGTSDIGKPCTSNGQCQFGLCAQNTHTGVNFCTKVCNRCDPQPCPPGSGCQNAGLAYICAPGYPNAPCP